MNWLTQPLERVFLRPLRSLGGLSFDVVVSEEHEDTLTIAKHPVEQGANISDHAYRNPCKVVIRGASSESTYGLPVWDPYNATLYNALLALQNAMREALGLKTTLSGTETRGKITLSYNSAQELEHLYEVDVCWVKPGKVVSPYASQLQQKDPQNEARPLQDAASHRRHSGDCGGGGRRRVLSVLSGGHERLRFHPQPH